MLILLVNSLTISRIHNLYISLVDYAKIRFISITSKFFKANDVKSMYLVAYFLNLPYSSLLSATICGPRTLSFCDRPFLISIFTPSLRPVVTWVRS